MSRPATHQPAPQLFFQTINSYQRTEALKAAIELEVFTAIREGNFAVPEIAKRCQTSERGMRILCDYLCIMGFLAKDGGRYSLTQDSAVFLDKRSPAYLGGSIEFLLSPMLTDGFKDLAAAVRKGGAVISGEGVVASEHPIWVKFARAMAPMMAMPAQLMAKLMDKKADRNLKILDIAAGHGLYGIAFAKTIRRLRSSRWIGRPCWKSRKRTRATPRSAIVTVRLKAARLMPSMAVGTIWCC
jgi:Dimerisation domain